MAKKFLLMVVRIGSAAACIAASILVASEEASREISQRNVAAVLDILLPVVHSSGSAVRIYYRGACSRNGEDPVPFPAVKVQTPSKDEAGLAAVREIFGNDKDVRVTEEPVGIVRIRIGEVSTAILQTKLSSLALDPLQQYNPRDAIAALESTKEVEVNTRSLGLTQPLMLAGTVAEPQEDLPRLPSSIKNVSLDQALDMIAKTWAGEGVVIYGACGEATDGSGRTPFFIDYVGDVVPQQLRKDIGTERPH